MTDSDIKKYLTGKIGYATEKERLIGMIMGKWVRDVIEGRIVDSHAYYAKVGAWNNKTILEEIFPKLLLDDDEHEERIIKILDEDHKQV